MHLGRMLGASLHCVTWVVRPGLDVGEDGRQCLSLARRRRRGKVNLSPPVTERQDGFHSCSQFLGSKRRAKPPCEELAASSAAALSSKGECP